MLTAWGVFAQEKLPAGSSLSTEAAKHFPQPVEVGTLLHRTVLQPLESQPVLGHVDAIVRARDGTLQAVVAYGGIFGLGVRPIAVPIDAMVLLGYDMEIEYFTPKDLNGFPTYNGAGTTRLASSDTIKVGLARPSH